MRLKPHTIFFGVLGLIVIMVGLAASRRDQRWAMSAPLRDEELDAAFFAGVDAKQIADVPEATSLRPCCIFGNDVGAQVGVWSFVIRYTQFNTPGTAEKVAANNLIITLTLFFAGRFIGTLLMSKFRPAVLLATFAVADVALRTVRAHLLGETGIERVTFVLRGDALEAFTRRLRTL